MYNYLEAMKDDIEFVMRDYEWGNFFLTPNFDETDVSELRDKMFDDLWVEDSVTGNGSGSYTFNREKAKEYVTCNMDLLDDACKDFGTDMTVVGQKFLDEDWEWFDVTIRCYLLSQAIDEILDEAFN